jgi:pimeloyl-ACP methyl ester carboxylesterase
MRPETAIGDTLPQMPSEYLGEQLVHWITEGDAPILYLHGVPNGAVMWKPFLERTGGVAVDLPGFGESGKRGDLDTSFEALGRFVGEFVEHLGWPRVRLCMHDWGAVGLLWAMREPERVERLVLIDAVPFLPGYRWHRVARRWRTRFVGEMAMGLSIRPILKRSLPKGMGEEVADAFDVGTQRSILRLYRSADEDRLAAAGAGLKTLQGPAFVAWGERDPYIPAGFAHAYAEALGGPTDVRVLSGQGHWPWLRNTELLTDVADFMTR